MYQLEKDQYYKISLLIKELELDCTFAYGVAYNGMPGNIFVDNNLEPKACLIAGDGGVYLVAGNEEQKEYNSSLIKFLEYKGNHTKYYDLFTTSSKWFDILAEGLKGDSIPLLRKIYSYQLKETPNFHKEIQLEEGYQLKRMNEALFNQFVEEIYPLHLKTWGSYEKFCKEGIAYVLLHKGKMISICFACSIGGGYAEIGVLTNEYYQRNGFALITCAAYIEECLEKGIVPVWNCGKGNIPSEKLAEKLNFTFIKDSKLIFWHENQKIIQAYLEGKNLM